MEPNYSADRVKAEVEQKRAGLLELEKMFEDKIKSGGFFQRWRYQRRLDELRDSPDYKVYVASFRANAKAAQPRIAVAVPSRR